MKAFFIDCDELAFAEAARSLQRERGWEVCFWTAGPELEDRVKSYFPAAVFQSNLAAARDIPPAELRGLVRRPPDAALLDALAPHENPVLKMMDRMGSGTGCRWPPARCSRGAGTGRGRPGKARDAPVAP